MKPNRSKFRWLPVTLFFVVVLLLFKVGLTVGTSIHKGHLQLSPPEVLAAGEKKEKTQESAAAPAAAPVPAPVPAAAPASPASKKETQAPRENARSAAQTPAKPSNSSSVAETMSYLQQREADLKKKEDQLREKEESLAKLEKDVEQKLKDLIGIQKEIQAYRSEKEEALTGKVRSLSKIYGTMKPKEAAKLLENLDEKLVMGIMQTMNSDEAAAILSSMDVKKAAKISEFLSGR